ncbi:Chorion peroxidase, partial [Araneus ventricosus]
MGHFLVSLISDESFDNKDCSSFMVEDIFRKSEEALL